MEKLRVVYITRGFSDYIVELVNGMSRYVEAHVVLPGNMDDLVDSFKDEVVVYRSHSPRTRSLGNINYLRKLIKYIKDIKPDIIHMQSGAMWELVLKFFIKDTPFVVTSHDPIKHSRHKLIDLHETPQFIVNKSLSQADAVIVHSSRMKKLVQNKLPKVIKNKPLYDVPHGVLSKFGTEICSVKPKCANVLCFGRIEAYKGIKYLIEAEPLIRAEIPQVKIIIAGQCREKDYYRSLISNQQHIELELERQPDSDVTGLFKWADVLALPYTDATQSGVLQIGYSFALPAVVTNVGGLPDVIKNQENGLLVPPKNPNALAKAIVRLLRDTGLRQKIISNLVEYRENVYSWDNIARKNVKIYNDIIDRKFLSG